MNASNLLIVDAEGNGLYGTAFAVGAVLMNTKGEVVDRFYARAPLPDGEAHSRWVETNVLPALDPETHGSVREMRHAFWAWFQAHKAGATVFGDIGSPVVSGLFRACVWDDPDARMWSVPYPLHEVATVLWTVGLDPDTDREWFAAELLSGREVRKHHPGWNAEVSGLVVLKAMRHPSKVPVADGETLSAVTESQATANTEARIRADRNRTERKTASTFDLSYLRGQLVAAAAARKGSFMTTGLPLFVDDTARDYLKARVEALARELEPTAHVAYRMNWQFLICWTEAAMQAHYPQRPA